MAVPGDSEAAATGGLVSYAMCLRVPDTRPSTDVREYVIVVPVLTVVLCAYTYLIGIPVLISGYGATRDPTSLSTTLSSLARSISLRARYAMSGTGIANAMAMLLWCAVLSVWCCTVCGTEIAYGAR
eukprot:2349356-Rhodomonas_salina.1